MADKSKKNEVAKSEWRLTVAALGLQEHLEILRRNDIHVDVQRIGDPDQPAVELVKGLLFRRDEQRTGAFIEISSRHKQPVEGSRRGRFGDLLLDFQVDVRAAYYRDDGRNAVPVDENFAPVELATPLAFYANGECTVPTDGVDGVVFWRYRNGRKSFGLFLPLDLEAANAAGWFNRAAAHAGVQTEVQLYPGVGKGKRRGGRLQPQTILPSGHLVIFNFPMFVDWGVPCTVLLNQHGRNIFAQPVHTVGTTQAIEAVAEAVADTADLALGDGEEVGPEEVRVSMGDVRSIWAVLAKVHEIREVTFDAITENSTYGQINSAMRAVAHAIHPDKLEVRLKKVPGVPASSIVSAVKAAAMQWAPIGEAFKKAKALRDAQWETVSAALGDVTFEAALGGASQRKVRNRKEGEDVLGPIVAQALGLTFDWGNANLVALRVKAFNELRVRAKVEEEPEEAPAPPAPPTEGEPPAVPEAPAPVAT